MSISDEPVTSEFKQIGKRESRANSQEQVLLSKNPGHRKSWLEKASALEYFESRQQKRRSNARFYGTKSEKIIIVEKVA